VACGFEGAEECAPKALEHSDAIAKKRRVFIGIEVL